MKRWHLFWLIGFILLICLPVQSIGSMTQGHVTFYEDSSLESPIKETVQSSDSKTSASSQEVTKESSVESLKNNELSTNNQKTLLQTNDTVNIVASVLGGFILIMAVYQIRRNRS